jgi:DNA-binding NtrC family response regulator
MTTPVKLLIVDDEAVALRNLQHLMSKEGYDVTALQSSVEAMALLKRHSFDIVLTDLRMESIDGMQILQTTRALYPDCEVIMITGYASTDSAVEAMHQGAFYYIAKPFRIEDVRKVVSEAAQKIALRRENQALRQQVASLAGKSRIITQNPSMQALMQLAQQIAPTDCNVLISGASGTGKELFARYIHQHSARHVGPYVAVNCGAFSRDLLANELFGHVKEAFTGATSAKQGLIEAASDGTLFLDEITEMPSEMQVKLLRVIQEKEVLRLGATQPIKTNIRIIAATNRDLNEALAQGLLRQDLYFRLNVVSLKIPPLAQRRDDIPLLCSYFLQRYSIEMRKDVDSISPEALSHIQAYPFPGNVRELENLIARGTALTHTHTIELAHLPDELQHVHTAPGQPGAGHIATLHEHEKAYIHWVLEQLGGNQSLAAQTLGINRSSLWRKLKAYHKANTH